MTCDGGIFKLNIYGDTFLKQLCPTLKKIVRIEVEDAVTLKGATIKKLHRRLLHQYKTKEDNEPLTDNSALIMVGTHDIMAYKNRDVWKFSRRLRKELSVFMAFIERYHKRIILLTALPVMKMQGNKQHWQLLRRYNKHIKSFSENPKVKIVDLFPVFVQKGNSQTCNADLYEKPEPDHETRKVYVWNDAGIEKAIRKILDAVVNVDKLQSPNVVSNCETGAKGNDCATIMETASDCLNLQDKNQECYSVNCLTEVNSDTNGKVDASDNGQENSNSNSSLAMEEPTKSIYSGKTVNLTEDVKEKLSWIRIKEYSSYGEELLKTNNIKSIENELLTIATYNVLSQDLLEMHKHIYANHDSRSLNWNLRKEILAEEFALLDADILCLQEVDFSQSDSVYNTCLYERGYEGVFKMKTGGKTEGCAIYFKSEKFNLVESVQVELFKNSVKLLDRHNVGLLLKLSLKGRPQSEMVIATTHLLYNPKRTDIRLVQTQIMLAEIERLAYKGTNPANGEPDYLPIIFTGDMNYSPNSAVYQLVTKNYFEYEGKPNKYLLPQTEGYILSKTLLPAGLGITDSCQYLSSLCNRRGVKNIRFETGSLAHPLKLSSVYSHIKNYYPEVTSSQESWLNVDYIYYSQSIDPVLRCRREGNLKLVWKLTLPNSKEAEAELLNIPNLGCGSDHLPLLAAFHFTGI